MTRLVVDASVIAKWFLLEEHAGYATRLINWDAHLAAPDLLLSELANVLVKAYRRADIPAPYIADSIAITRDLVSILPSADLVNESVRIALTYQCSPYDALYVALAIQEQCPLVTADRRLYDAIAPPLPDTMLWVEDVP